MNKRKGKKLGQWADYLIGLSGRGPTLLDVEPRCKLGRKEKIILSRAQKQMDEEATRRREGFRQACIEVLGEDPDEDWKCEIE